MTDNRWSVLLPEDMHESGPALLRDFADVTWLSEYDTYDDARDDITADKYDAIIVRTFTLDGGTLSNTDRLKVISKHGVGLDCVDLDAARTKGIPVTITPGKNVTAVAEHTIGMLLAVRKQFLPSTLDVKNGEWDRERYVAPELRGDTLGVFGIGEIGSRVAELAMDFGMNVTAYDPFVDASTVPDDVTLVDSIDTLCERIDALTIHAPLVEETRGAITESELRRLPPSGVVINCARGGIIDEDDLRTVLEDGSLLGAGIDVFVTEPPDEHDPLLALRNVLVTPHCAGSTEEAMRGMSECAAMNVRAIYDGERPVGIVE